MTEAEIGRGIEMLKAMCDPRGHALLDAIGEALLETVTAVDKLDALFDLSGGYVDGHRVAFDPNDNTHWSKRVELRSVR